MAIEHQPSAEVCEFLTLYLLERASEGPFDPGRLMDEVLDRSEGDLRPAETDVRAAQSLCCERGWLESTGRSPDGPASLSAAGQAELARRTEEMGSSGGERDFRREAADRIIDYLSPPDGSEVLDVGTGEGFLAKALAAAGFTVLGIDIDTAAVESALAGTSPGGKLRFEVADVHSLAGNGQTWHTVVSSYVLHECEDPVTMLRAICSCLAPGGMFACTDFAPNSAAYLSRAGRSRFHPFRALAEGDWRALAPELHLASVDYSWVGYVSIALAQKEGGSAATAEP